MIPRRPTSDHGARDPNRALGKSWYGRADHTEGAEVANQWIPPSGYPAEPPAAPAGPSGPDPSVPPGLPPAAAAFTAAPRSSLQPVQTSRAPLMMFVALLALLVATAAPYGRWFGIAIDDVGDVWWTGWGRTQLRVDVEGEPVPGFGGANTVTVESGTPSREWILGPVSDGFALSVVTALAAIAAYVAFRLRQGREARGAAVLVVVLALGGLGWIWLSYSAARDDFHTMRDEITERAAAYGLPDPFESTGFRPGNGLRVAAVALTVTAVAGLAAATARTPPNPLAHPPGGGLAPVGPAGGPPPPASGPSGTSPW